MNLENRRTGQTTRHKLKVVLWLLSPTARRNQLAFAYLCNHDLARFVFEDIVMILNVLNVLDVCEVNRSRREVYCSSTDKTIRLYGQEVLKTDRLRGYRPDEEFFDLCDSC